MFPRHCGSDEDGAISLEAFDGGFDFRDEGVELSCECGDAQALQFSSLEFPHLLPELGLGVFERGADLRREQRAFLVPVRVPARRPASRGEEDFFDVGFEGGFGGFAEHGLVGFSFSVGVLTQSPLSQNYFHFRPQVPLAVCFPK